MSIEYPQKDLSQKIALFMKNHANTVRVSKTPPIRSSGNNGDIVLVQTGLRAYLYAKMNGQWRRFEESQGATSASNQIHLIHGAFYHGTSNAELYAHLKGFEESTSIISYPYLSNFPWPYNGRVRKIKYSQSGFTTSTDSEMTIKLYKVGVNLNLYAAGNYSMIKQVDVSLSSAYEMKEIPLEGIYYSKGEELKISFQSPNRAIKAVNFTIELELIN